MLLNPYYIVVAKILNIAEKFWLHLGAAERSNKMSKKIKWKWLVTNWIWYVNKNRGRQSRKKNVPESLPRCRPAPRPLQAAPDPANTHVDICMLTYHFRFHRPVYEQLLMNIFSPIVASLAPWWSDIWCASPWFFGRMERLAIISLHTNYKRTAYIMLALLSHQSKGKK